MLCRKLDEFIENPNLVASITNRLAGVYFQKSDLEQATKYLQKSVVLREQLGDKVAVARSYNNLGLLKWRRGDWQDALQYFNKSLEINTVRLVTWKDRSTLIVILVYYSWIEEN